MTVTIERVRASTPALAEFIAAHHADMVGTAPPESQHALPLDGLLAPAIRLFTAVEAGAIVATGALAAVEDGHEELKSMRTHPDLRGRGIGRTMLAFLIDDARGRGIRRLSLETGADDFFAPARMIYTRAGFVECDAFGRYSPDPLSTFMTLALVRSGSERGTRRGIMNG
ncbi:GNAT family N-acetyltransferase [Microbacterium sp. M28]|uniref:GNAT family N-acetyltransferase n=1 Tax=Microbacterium sp. M28 TaxID=2962064 RepID=UPI0021F482B1|nr:GNAT family N-acetyltransferase [Microbacterium sp. M28]UYO96137.1 GNAT family N-acetyltransferase [Microbacterium sp. M28]